MDGKSSNEIGEGSESIPIGWRGFGGMSVVLPWLQSKSISRGEISRSIAVISSESVQPSSGEVKGEHPSMGRAAVINGLGTLSAAIT